MNGEPLAYERVAKDKVSDDDRLALMWFEALANEDKISPRAMMLFEVDCADGRFRPLSVSIHPKGGPDSHSTAAGNWDYTPPDSNGDRLMRLVCPPQK